MRGVHHVGECLDDGHLDATAVLNAVNGRGPANAQTLGCFDRVLPFFAHGRKGNGSTPAKRGWLVVLERITHPANEKRLGRIQRLGITMSFHGRFIIQTSVFTCLNLPQMRKGMFLLGRRSAAAGWYILVLDAYSAP